MEHGNESLGSGWSTSRPFVVGFRWLRFAPRNGLHPVPPVRSSSYFCFRPADPGRGLARFTPATPGRGAAHSASRLRHCRPTRWSSLSSPRVPPLVPPHPLVEPVETRVPPLLPPHPLVELVETLFVAGFWWLRFVPRSGLHPVPPVRSSSYFCCRVAVPGRGLARFTPTTPGRGAAHSALRSRHCRLTRWSSLSRTPQHR